MGTKVAKQEEMENLPVSAEFMEEILDHGGMGYSENSEDSLIPILAILQDNSAEIKKKHEKYIDGAEAGDMIIRSLQRVFKVDTDGNTSLRIQPCAFQHVWVAWDGDPGEGAPVQQYPFDDMPEHEEVKDPQNPDKTLFITPEGYRLVDTRYHFGQIVDGDELIPIIVPMSGSNHTVSRAWTAQMKQFKVPGKNTRAPAFFRTYSFSTTFTQKGANSWYRYKITDLGWLTDEFALRSGFEMMKAVDSEVILADVTKDEVEKDDVPI